MGENRTRILEQFGMLKEDRKIFVEGGEFLEKNNNDSFNLLDCNGKILLKNYSFRIIYDRYLYIVKQNRLYVFYFSDSNLKKNHRILIETGNVLITRQYVAIVAYENYNKILAVFDHELKQCIYDENGLNFNEGRGIIRIRNSKGHEIRFKKN